MIARNSIALAFVLSFAASALAQETRRLPAEGDKTEIDRGSKAGSESAKHSSQENLTFDDLRNSLGDLEQKESKEETSKRDQIVQKNVDETLKIYSDTLGKKNGELQNVNRRLDANKGLEGKYDKLLKTARTGLATTRAQYINRTVGLKRSLEEGKISKDAYDKLLEEDTKRFRNREKELLDDIAFYADEFQNAQKSSKDLSTKKELMSFDPFGGNDAAAEKEKVPQPGIEQKLKSTLGEVSGFGGRSVVDSLK
jgi:hypothetical protein